MWGLPLRTIFTDLAVYICFNHKYTYDKGTPESSLELNFFSTVQCSDVAICQKTKSHKIHLSFYSTWDILLCKMYGVVYTGFIDYM